jgi:benzodiazapine receptor
MKIDQILVASNVIALIGVLIVNALANILPINGMNTGEISALYPNLFTPAGITFSIWSIIYLLLIGFILCQGFIIHKFYFVEFSLWFMFSCLANISWILVWHYLLTGASVVVMIILLFSLIKIFVLIQTINFTSNVEYLFVKLPFIFYFSWICVATIANISALLVSLDWKGGFLLPQTWTIIMISVAFALAVFISSKYKEPTYLLVSIWAFFGIYYKWTETDNNIIALTALGALLLLSVLFLILQFQMKSSWLKVKRPNSTNSTY